MKLPEPLYRDWVADVSMSMPVFCPIDGDINGEYRLITGISYISDEPPEGGRLVAIVHEDGQGAVEEWCEQNPEMVERWQRIGRERG